MNTPIITVKLWGTTIGYLGYAPGQKRIATFSYEPKFMASGIQVSPLSMEYPGTTHTFDNISEKTFHGLPGIIADSLPDKFGNKLIDLYFAQKGLSSSDITTLDRLAYIGKRSMGAFEYEPALNDFAVLDGGMLDIHHLGGLAAMVLEHKEEFAKKLSDAGSQHEEMVLIRIGSSAGGARAKALVARDDAGKFYDGTMDVGADKRYWLLKFDTASNSDREVLRDPKGMTRVEYVYSLIARKCGIDIPQTDYILDGDDFHFMIERFDREAVGEKVLKKHYASWAGLSHNDRDHAGAYSYDQFVLDCNKLKLGQGALNEVYRRMVFNVVGRNHDDHTKNFGFLMNRRGEWSLSPAFDMTYSFDPHGKWTKEHQLRLGEKRDNFTREDLIGFGVKCNLKELEAAEVIDRTREAFGEFSRLAQEYDIDPLLRTQVASNLRGDSLGRSMTALGSAKLYEEKSDGVSLQSKGNQSKPH